MPTVDNGVDEFTTHCSKTYGILYDQNYWWFDTNFIRFAACLIKDANSIQLWR